MPLWRRFEIFNTDYFYWGMYLESWNFSAPLQDILGPLLAILGSFLRSVKYSNTATSHPSKIHIQRKIRGPFRCIPNLTKNLSQYEFWRVSRWILLYILFFDDLIYRNEALNTWPWNTFVPYFLIPRIITWSKKIVNVVEDQERKLR
jgi:hypothetical protein